MPEYGYLWDVDGRNRAADAQDNMIEAGLGLYKVGGWRASLACGTLKLIGKLIDPLARK